MIEIDFKTLCDQGYASDEYHQLYVVFNGKGDVLYIGITRRNVWERWFGFGGHMIYDKGRFLGLSAIGTKIEDYLPDSLK